MSIKRTWICNNDNDNDDNKAEQLDEKGSARRQEKYMKRVLLQRSLI
jgi:hypothetical protein